MIQAIHISNVQSIEHLTLSLGKITVITGASHKGKTALVRGLLAMFTNSFRKSLLRFGKQSLQVGVVIDGKAIGFVKGQSSYYFIDKRNFTKVGKDIPKDVSDLLKLSKIQFDKDIEYFLPIQSQLQKDFLIGDYGGVASKVIGKLSNLGLVYIARRRALSEQKSLKQKSENAKASSNRFLVEGNKLKEILLKIDFSDMQQKLDDIKSLQESLAGEELIVENISTVEQFKRTQQKQQKLSEDLFTMNSQVKQLEEMALLLLSISEAVENINSFLLAQKDYSEIELSESNQVLLEIALSVDVLNILSETIAFLKKQEEMVSQQMKFKEEISSLSLEIDNLSKELGVCPTCLRKF